MTIKNYIAGLVATTVCALIIYGVVVLGDFRYMIAGQSALDIILVYYFGKKLFDIRRKSGNV